MSAFGRRSLPLAASVALFASTACSHIETRSRVEVTRRPSAVPQQLGSGAGQVTARGLDVDWSQRGTAFEVQVFETRRCRKIEHVPVTRVVHLERRAGQAMYWEYGIAAAFLAVGLTGLIRPELFSAEFVNQDGDRVRDTRTGYRIGGIFTAIGGVALTAGIVDTVRARDETVFTDAYEVQLGEQVSCQADRVPASGRPIELASGAWTARATTDADGRARFELPRALDPARPPTKVDRLPGDVAPPSGPPQRVAVHLRIGTSYDVAMDAMTPLDSEAAREHAGHFEIAPDERLAPALSLTSEEES